MVQTDFASAPATILLVLAKRAQIIRHFDISVAFAYSDP
jgi:hypothetical protein